MYGYIYLTTNLINGKKYIGQHRSDTFTEDYKGSGKYLWNAINKYGWDNFRVELLESCNSPEELNERETYWIRVNNAVSSPEYYNITPGGNNHNPYKGLTDEEYKDACDKISNSQVGKRWMNNGTIEVRADEHEAQNYLSEGFSYGQLPSHRNTGSRNGMFGNTHTPEVCAKLSECNTSENNPSYGKHWYTNGKDNILIYDNDSYKYPDYYRGRTRYWTVVFPNNKGTILINNGETVKRIPASEYDSYDKLIWKRGKILMNKTIGKKEDSNESNNA